VWPVLESPLRKPLLETSVASMWTWSHPIDNPTGS
jgi:hypothetical protein